jgi:choline dehydrogenase-like flavoprotein
MGRLPFGPGEQAFTDAAARIDLVNLPSAQARNSGVAYDDRPPCCGNNSCVPICPIGAKYDAASSLPRIEAKGGKILVNSVVYKIETGARNVVQAVHYMTPEKETHRVTGAIFVIACNGIETPKILLMSTDDRNPRGVANSSDQVGRNMMDQPKLVAQVELAKPAWTGVGPVQGSSIMQTSQGAFRSEHAGALFRFENKARTRYEAANVLKTGLVGKALDTELRRRIACTAELTVEHELIPLPDNRLTLSAQKDWLGLPKPNIYYDVSDYIRKSAETYTKPILRNLARELGATKIDITPNFAASCHIMGGMIMGADGATSVVDADCRAHDHANLFLPGGGAMTTGGVGNSTLTMAALAFKAADAIQAQIGRAA